MDKKKVIERQINKTKGFEGIADYVFAQSNGRIFTRKNGIEKTMQKNHIFHKTRHFLFHSTFQTHIEI